MEIRIVIDDEKLRKAIGIIRPAMESLLDLADGKTSRDEPKADDPKSESSKEENAAARGKEYTFEEVRAILTAKSREGYTDAVKALVNKYGGGKLSTVKSENYADLLNEAEFSCRKPFTREEISARIGELEKKGYSAEIPALLEHHLASSLDDLKPEHYVSFMRDAWRLDHAWK